MAMAMAMVTAMAMVIQKMIDIHNHFLPGVDDGSVNIEMTEKLFFESSMQGVKKIFLTPHVNSSVSKVNRKEQIRIFNQLKPLANKYNLEIFLGAEIYIPFRLPDLNFEDYVMGNSNVLLVEFSTRSETEIIDLVYNLIKRNYRIIIAHVERYYYLDSSDINDLKNMGVFFQVNSSSIISNKHREYHKRALKYIKSDLIDFVATDSHDILRRKPNLKNAFEKLNKIVGRKKAKDLIYNNQMDLFFPFN